MSGAPDLREPRAQTRFPSDAEAPHRRHPHDLGQAEAKRRLMEGTEQVRALLQKRHRHRPAGLDGDRLDFGVSAVAQKVAGSIDVGTESVRLEVKLPFLLALFAEKIQKVASKEATLLLTKK